MKHTATRKMCGNCEYWNGRREFADGQNKQKIEIQDEIAQCENEESIFFSRDREKTRCCCRFMKWNEEA